MYASVIDLYDQLTNAPDDRARARILAQAFEALETRYPHISELATRTNLSETELKLTKEIEAVRAELKETELKLTKEIEAVRAELKETELKLTKEIEAVRADLTKEIEQVRLEVARVRADLGRDIEHARSSLLLWSFGFWITQLVVLLTLLWRLWPLAGS